MPDARNEIQGILPTNFMTAYSGVPRLQKVVQPEWDDGHQPPNFEPAPPPSNWKELVLQISTSERARYQDARRTETEKMELQRQIEALKQERESNILRHKTEMESVKRDFDRRNREALMKMRQENLALEEEVRQTQTKHREAEMRRQEAEGNLEILRRRISKLEVDCARREAEAEKEVERVKGERDASYRRTQEKAEERVRAMCDLAKEAQDKMYKNMEDVEMVRRRLTVRADQFPGIPRVSRTELTPITDLRAGGAAETRKSNLAVF